MLSEHLPDLSTFSESGPFSLYRAILRELKSRGVIRTENAPVGDYAEYLVATALGGQLAANSEKSWDVLSENGEKPQVKARVVSEPAEPGQLQLSPFRSFGFDSAIIVLRQLPTTPWQGHRNCLAAWSNPPRSIVSM
jgi:hypothetical protein